MNANSDDLWVVIAAYNEGAVIDSVVRAARRSGAPAQARSSSPSLGPAWPRVVWMGTRGTFAMS